MYPIRILFVFNEDFDDKEKFLWTKTFYSRPTVFNYQVELIISTAIINAWL